MKLIANTNIVQRHCASTSVVKMSYETKRKREDFCFKFIFEIILVFIACALDKNEIYYRMNVVQLRAFTCK